jgi:hypothetical protein
MPAHSQYQKTVTAEGYDGVIISEENNKILLRASKLQGCEKHFRMSNANARWKLQVLAEGGKLKYTISLVPESSKQRFFNPDVEIIQLGENEITDYCRIYERRADFRGVPVCAHNGGIGYIVDAPAAIGVILIPLPCRKKVYADRIRRCLFFGFCIGRA